jgi:hypothetical protein
MFLVNITACKLYNVFTLYSFLIWITMNLPKHSSNYMYLNSDFFLNRINQGVFVMKTECFL